ncbi:MAG: biotin/lipoyl-binding protein [Bryobacterales bacterium]|nr:biotin/lipoyl-binding protein [Bryobacterales bacterium]
MKLKVTVDGKTYEVEVEAAEDPHPAPAAYMTQPAPVRVPAGAPPAPAAPPAEGGDKVCRSPISGIVVKLSAQTGQQIQPGDILIVLEAMKMETNITAPVAGRIAAIKVNVGDNVQSGQVVVEFE